METNFNCPVSLLAGTKIKVNDSYIISSSSLGSKIGYKELEGEIKNTFYSNGKLVYFTLNYYHSQSYLPDNIIELL